MNCMTWTMSLTYLNDQIVKITIDLSEMYGPYSEETWTRANARAIMPSVIEKLKMMQDECPSPTSSSASSVVSKKGKKKK